MCGFQLQLHPGRWGESGEREACSHKQPSKCNLRPQRRMEKGGERAVVADKGPGGNYLDSGWETLKPFIAFYEAKSTCIYLDGGRSNSSQLTWHLEQSAVSAAWGPVSGIHQEAGGFLTGGASVRVIGPGSPLHMSIFQELCRKRASNSHRPPPGLTCGPLSGHGRWGWGAGKGLRDKWPLAFCSGPRLQFAGALWESSGLLAQRLQTAREAW